MLLAPRDIPANTFPAICWLRAVFVEDLAQIAMDAARRQERVTVDAAGPEVFSFNESVRLIAGMLGRRVRMAHPTLVYFITRILGFTAQRTAPNPRRLTERMGLPTAPQHFLLTIFVITNMLKT